MTRWDGESNESIYERSDMVICANEVMGISRMHVKEHLRSFGHCLDEKLRVC